MATDFFNIDDSDLKSLEKGLQRFASQSLPYATRDTLNQAAFNTQKEAKRNISEKMIERNKWTAQSVRVEKSQNLDISRQRSAIGSIADYMETQELGGVKSKEGKEGVPIATSYSSGESENTRPRKRLPRRPNKLRNIELQRKRKIGKNRKQQNLIAIKQAAESGRKFIYLNFGRNRGIFRVIGGKRKPRLKMLHNLSKASVTIPKNPWLIPARNQTIKKLPGLYQKAIEFQLRRNKLIR